MMYSTVLMLSRSALADVWSKELRTQTQTHGNVEQNLVLTESEPFIVFDKKYETKG